jgi:hypothetical protein
MLADFNWNFCHQEGGRSKTNRSTALRNQALVSLSEFNVIPTIQEVRAAFSKGRRAMPAYPTPSYTSQESVFL